METHIYVGIDFIKTNKKNQSTIFYFTTKKNNFTKKTPLEKIRQTLCNY